MSGNNLKKAIAHRTSSGIEGIDLNLSQGWGARVHNVTFALKADTVSTTVLVEMGVSRFHYDNAYDPNDYGEIWSEESNFLHWGYRSFTVGTEGVGVNPCVKRIHLFPEDQPTFVINNSFSMYCTASIVGYVILEFEHVRLSPARVAEIYNWQGGIT